MSVVQVKDFIRRLHAQGMYALMYFNPTEAWQPWIKENYPGDLVKKFDGSYFPCWYESYMVCPNPDSPWGKHLLQEFTRMMDLYPQADGFFMDQSCYDILDCAHDDGCSIDGGQTGYRMNWAIDQISRECRKLAKARGKFLWWNGPYQADIASFAEGMMAEAGDDNQMRAIQYLAMGGRTCCTLAQSGEDVFRRCAIYGLYPTAMETPALRRVAQRYWPIFNLFRDKRWIFAAHALTLPQGAQGNIYRLGDGNVLAVMVTPSRSLDDQPCDKDLPLRMRLADAGQFRAAYFLSPDLQGKRRLHFDRRGQAIEVILPRHRSVSAVLLAKTGIHAALDGPFEVATGQQVTAALVLDNWTAQPASATWSAAGAAEEPITVQPQTSVRRAVRFTAPGKRQNMREVFTCRMAWAGGPPADCVEFYIGQPPSADLRVP
jgi:hypothetical protein